MQDLEPREWTAERLARINHRFVEAPPGEILDWGLDSFSPDLCLATSFGPQSIVLMHLISRIRPETTVFYLDTELLFPETYALRDELSERLGLSFTRVTASLSLDEQSFHHGEALWARSPNRCCHLRKVLPLRRFLAGKRAWITGIRRVQTHLRAATGVVEWDATNGLVKLNPLASWPTGRVRQYILDHGLPFNKLHLEGYPSIGCRPCTRPVLIGEDARKGR